MSEQGSRSGLLRTRWAAIGAAIAVTLGAGGIGISHATTTSGERPIYLPIEPCRLADTRPAFNVGPRATPLGAAETYDIAGWGNVGNCNLPTNTAGLALNVTAVDPSAPTFLTLFPDGTTLPLASHLNPTPGQPPTPNAVNVDLSAAGNFSIYNLAGNVHVAIDVVGIFDDHNHDDRYYTEAESDGRYYTKTESDAMFLPRAPIVLMHSTSDIEDHNNGETSASLGSGARISSGYANLGITGPVSIGGVNYRLDSVEYCVEDVGTTFITAFQIWREGPGTAITDGTDRTTDGCYTLGGETGAVAFAYDIQWLTSGPGAIRITGVRSTWVPIT